MMMMFAPMMFAAPDAVNKKGNIGCVFVVMLFPVFIFGLLWLIGAEFWGISGKKWFIGVGSTIGVIALLSGLPRLFLNASKGILNSGYSVFEGSIYYNGEAIKHSDGESFQYFLEEKTVSESEQWLSREEYVKDKNYVYYQGAIVEHANPDAFKSFNQDRGGFWIDDKYVYHGSSVLPHAKPEGFSLLDENAFSNGYAKYIDGDQGYVYRYSEIVNGADPHTFELLKNADDLGKDKQRIYNHTDAILDDADVKTFESLDDNFGRDKHSVYKILIKGQSKKIENINPESFEVLDREFARDDKTVLYGIRYEYPQVIDFLDAPSLIILDYGYLKDKHAVYMIDYSGEHQGVKKIEDADAATFEMLNSSNYRDGDAKDKNGAFSSGKRINNR